MQFLFLSNIRFSNELSYFPPLGVFANSLLEHIDVLSRFWKGAGFKTGLEFSILQSFVHPSGYFFFLRLNASHAQRISSGDKEKVWSWNREPLYTLVSMWIWYFLNITLGPTKKRWNAVLNVGEKMNEIEESFMFFPLPFLGGMWDDQSTFIIDPGVTFRPIFLLWPSWE